ncbi:MAG TPA: glycosyltransferase family 4 protein, partial [Anaerolineales bacterium]|nr:glycosyltransferase family 4 protein [Anaerolineales bacterium]
WVPNRDAPAYFHAADLYLMPSLEEGFPRVLLEAMASACPFVAFDIGGVSDILTREQAAELVRAGAVDEFTRRCVDLMKNHNLRQLLAAAGLERVQAFDEERVAEMFVEMMGGNAPRWPGADGARSNP